MTSSHLGPHLFWGPDSFSSHTNSADVELLAQKDYRMFARSRSVSRNSWGKKPSLFFSTHVNWTLIEYIIVIFMKNQSMIFILHMKKEELRVVT